MGNHNGRQSHDATVSPLDFFHTAPTTPSEAELSAVASAPTSAPNKPQTPSPAGGTTLPVAEWTQNLCAPSEWAVISVDRITCSEASDGESRLGEAAGSPTPPPRGSSPEQSWQERDSGLEPQAAEETAGEEMTLVLVSLMEHYGASLGLNPNTDVTTGAVELLRLLITQKDKLVEEVDTLREMLRKERLEWQQFQCDLQVAVAVADRLRVEAEQDLDLLQENHKAVAEQLAQALSRQQEKDRELERLRAEHEDICRKLNDFTLKQHQQEEEREGAACDHEAERQDSEEELQNVEEAKTQEATEAANVEKQKENKTNQEAKSEDPEEGNGSENMQLTGKGVAEAYLRSLAVLEKKKQKDPRRIAMLSERAWSLSRLVLPSDPSSEEETSKNTSTTLPLCKKEEPQKQRRMDRVLQRQDSWSSFYTGKQEEGQSSDCIKPQDCFSALMRRHGGSRRNSLLRWCQSRTQGYKNIEITNFSSSWEDGLAFCAVYHTYVPTVIPYDTLSPANKMENLHLAFKTGESLGIPATLAMEEMLKADGPNWQKVLGYVESIFRHLEM